MDQSGETAGDIQKRLQIAMAERDRAVAREAQLEAQLLSLTQQFKSRAQSNMSMEEAQKIRQQNHHYREQFTFLQKEAKSIVQSLQQEIVKKESQFKTSLKQAQQARQLQTERNVLLKKSKEEAENKAKQLDKKYLSLQNKLKKLLESNNHLKQQLQHSKKQYLKLQQHCDAIKQRHQDDMDKMHHTIQNMNQHIKTEREQLESRHSNMFKQKTAQYERLNREMTENINTIGELRDQSQRMKEQRDILQQQFNQSQKTISQFDGQMKKKDTLIGALQKKVQIQRKAREQYLQYIGELEEKCRLLENLGDCRRLKERLKDAQEQRDQVRIQLTNMSIENEKNRRRAEDEMLQYKKSEESVVRDLYRQIEKLNAVIQSKELDIDRIRKESERTRQAVESKQPVKAEPQKVVAQSVPQNVPKSVPISQSAPIQPSILIRQSLPIRQTLPQSVPIGINMALNDGATSTHQPIKSPLLFNTNSANPTRHVKTHSLYTAKISQ